MATLLVGNTNVMACDKKQRKRSGNSGGSNKTGLISSAGLFRMARCAKPHYILFNDILVILFLLSLRSITYCKYPRGMTCFIPGPLCFITLLQ